MPLSVSHHPKQRHLQGLKSIGHFWVTLVQRWEIRSGERRESLRKKVKEPKIQSENVQRIPLWQTGRKQHLTSLLVGEEGFSQRSIPTHAWCWRAHGHSSCHQALHLHQQFPLQLSYLCDSSSAGQDIWPRGPLCIFITGACIRETDAAGLRRCRLQGLPRGDHALSVH